MSLRLLTSPAIALLATTIANNLTARKQVKVSEINERRRRARLTPPPTVTAPPALIEELNAKLQSAHIVISALSEHVGGVAPAKKLVIEYIRRHHQ